MDAPPQTKPGIPKLLVLHVGNGCLSQTKHFGSNMQSGFFSFVFSPPKFSLGHHAAQKCIVCIKLKFYTVPG